MPIFPKIERPCPYVANLDAIMDGDMCRACQRPVFDLTAMDDGERRAFMAGCAGEVCVSYRFARPMVAAAALAAAAMAAPAYAQDVPAGDATYEASQDIIVMAGGITDPSQAKFAHAEEIDAPPLPVTYEDEADVPAAEEAPDVSQD